MKGSSIISESNYKLPYCSWFSAPLCIRMEIIMLNRENELFLYPSTSVLPRRQQLCLIVAEAPRPQTGPDPELWGLREGEVWSGQVQTRSRALMVWEPIWLWELGLHHISGREMVREVAPLLCEWWRSNTISNQRHFLTSSLPKHCDTTLICFLF